MGEINIHKIDLSTQTIAEWQNLDAAIQEQLKIRLCICGEAFVCFGFVRRFWPSLARAVA
jgi:hypothetical protein